MRKVQILLNKPVYLRLSILGLSKTVMYEFWYAHVKQKSFIILVKTGDIYQDIAEDIETKFDT